MAHKKGTLMIEIKKTHILRGSTKMTSSSQEEKNIFTIWGEAICFQTPHKGDLQEFGWPNSCQLLPYSKTPSKCQRRGGGSEIDYQVD